MKVECDAYCKCYTTSTIDSVHYDTTSMSHSPHSTPALSAFVQLPNEPTRAGNGPPVPELHDHRTCALSARAPAMACLVHAFSCTQSTAVVSAHPRALGHMDSTKRRWWAGATSSRVVLSARLYILYIHTRPTVAWGPPPGAVGSILITLFYAVTRSYHR